MLLLDILYILGILDSTQTFFIAGFRRECGKICKMSLEHRAMHKSRREGTCVYLYMCANVSLALGIPVSVQNVQQNLIQNRKYNTEKDRGISHSIRHFFREIPN